MSFTWIEGGSMSNTTPPKHFNIITKTMDTDPLSGHKTPPNAILAIFSDEAHGYLSAHRNAAQMTGRTKKIATGKSAEYDSETGEVIPKVMTYWVK